MTRVLLLGSDSASVRLIALALADKGIQVLDEQAFEQAERARQNMFELTSYEKLDLSVPTIFLEPTRPAHAPMRSLRQDSRFAQSAKQQSFRAKARR
jgi:hypothetical protein